MELLLFDWADSPKPAATIRFDPVADRTYHCWPKVVPNLRPGQIHACRAAGRWAPAAGLCSDCAKVLLDLYAHAVAIPALYDLQAAGKDGDDAATSLKSVVVDLSACDWEGDRPLRQLCAWTIIYEMHVRGVTRHPASGLEKGRHGTFAGLAERMSYQRDSNFGSNLLTGRIR
ncbi:hypothetical protein [Geminicoccus roseus]|uniref:hypothetical protein n=1 Tax=Geminicoccus roseus TaxID=404900 RepID=UPI0012F9BB88|nr:hypothetical protein [Geminicoccus roseus]